MTRLVSQGELIAFTSNPKGDIIEGVNLTSLITLVSIITRIYINGCKDDELLLTGSHIHRGITIVL